MNRIALIIPADVWYSPYVKIYSDILDDLKISYDVISWNKSNSSQKDKYCYQGKSGSNSISKLIAYYKFSKFVRSIIRENKYNKLIIFTSQAGIFLSNYLKKKYKNNYIFDFRDLSIEQSKIFKSNFNKLLRNSFVNVISSPGFKKYLPANYEYILSHNFDISQAQNNILQKGVFIQKNPIEILTIGGIRDYESNAPLMDSIGNNSQFILKFVGKGAGAEPLKEHCNENNYNNVFFEGYYDKEDEPKYVKESSFLNIYYPDIITHKTAISNRFYNSLIYRRPMIVTKGQIQGDYCEKYNLGIAVSDINNMPNQIEEWLDKNNLEEYEIRCINLLKEFLNDYSEFKSRIKLFTETK